VTSGLYTHTDFIVTDHIGTRSTSLPLEHLLTNRYPTLPSRTSTSAPPQIDSFLFSLVFRVLRHQYSDSTTDIIFRGRAM